MNRGDILDTAKEYILKDRNAAHGNPEDNFGNIATFWTAYLRMRNPHILITPIADYDVAIMQILAKICRTNTSPKSTENWIDICGYGGCGGQCATEPHVKS